MHSLLFVDIDETITLPRPHMKLVTNQDWVHFYQNALPNYPLIKFIQAVQPAFSATILCTGREDRHYDVTVEWLNNLQLPKPFKVDRIRMRKNNDMRSNADVKYEFYQGIKKSFHDSYVLVIDDNVKILEMVKNLGFATYDPKMLE